MYNIYIYIYIKNIYIYIYIYYILYFFIYLYIYTTWIREKNVSAFSLANIFLFWRISYRALLVYHVLAYIALYYIAYIYHIYVIMKTMCPSGYHHNGIVATHALGHMITYMLHSSSFCEIWALCVSWITYDHWWPLYFNVIYAKA